MARDDIVEVGAHASRRSRDTLALWAHTAVFLDRRAEIVVAVLTQPMRSMLTRAGVEIFPLAAASPDRVAGGAGPWGRYYDLDPTVCAGLIAPALPKLLRHAGRSAGLCA